MNELFVKCECSAEGVNISQCDETGDICFAMWYCGAHDLTWSHKLRWILQILGGKPFKDQIVIGAGWSAVIADYFGACRVRAKAIKDW